MPTHQHTNIGMLVRTDGSVIGFTPSKIEKVKSTIVEREQETPLVCSYCRRFCPLQERSNHSRLQRQSKHGALRRLQGRAATPFPDKYARSAASVFIGKTLHPTAPCKRAFENGNDRPATHRREKIIRSIGLERTELCQAHFGTFGTVGTKRRAEKIQTDRRHAAGVFTKKIP